MVDNHVNFMVHQFEKTVELPSDSPKGESFYYITKSVIKILLNPKGLIETCIENINDNINA